MSLTDILKTERIIKVDEDEVLSSVLNKLGSSHDAAFVFSKKNKYLGAINPYYCLIKSSYPANAKVKHCLFHPPKIYLDTTLTKVAQSMIDSKVHYLPVFLDKNKEEFVGIISARRLLSYFKNLELFKVKIAEVLKNKKPLVTIEENESIGKAINLFRKTHYSKLVVVNGGGKLKGVLSYFDLIAYLALPKTKEAAGDKKGEKISFLNLPVKNFTKTYVVVLKKDNFLSDVINLILEKKIGSVIIADKDKVPEGIVTTRDILQFFIQKNTSYEKPKNSTLQLGGFFKLKMI
jgi:CBS domain-containing protein